MIKGRLYQCGRDVGLGLVLMTSGICIATVPLAAQRTVATQTTSNDARAADTLLARPVTLMLTGVSLKQAIDSISRVAKVLLQYRLPVINTYTAPVTVSAVHLPLGIVLERLLDGTALRVVPDGTGDLEIVATGPARPDSIPTVGTVSGRVVDSATGRGLLGVTVKVAGTKISSLTQDSTGRFVLHDVPAGTQVLTAKVFGYRPSEHSVDVAAGQQSTVRMMLVSVPNVLSGVVTTATGTQRKIEVGNDITTLNADSLLKVAPITSVTDMLENRVPGLTVLHSSGTPGDPSRIRIRGAGSITGNNDPIVYVDGVRVYAAQSDTRSSSLASARLGGSSVSGIGSAGTGLYATPSPLDQIDPNSIQTIEVFKGPSASSLYGSDAANGVIVITTKRGQAGPTHWDANVGTGLTYEPRNWPVNYYRFGYGVNSSTLGSPFCAWNDLSCEIDSIVPYQALNDSRYSLFADHGSEQSGALTVSGGVPMLQYLVTGSGSGNLGIIKMPGLEQQRFLEQYNYAMPHWMLRPDKYSTMSGTGQLTVQPSASTSFTLSSTLFNSTQQRSSLEQAITELEGRYINPLILGASSLITNEYERVTSTNMTLTNALTANWAPASWLPLTVIGGLSTGQRVDKTYVPYGIYLNRISLGNQQYDTTGWFSDGHGTTFDKTLSLRTTIPVSRVTMSIGANYHSGSTDDFSAYTDQLAPGVSEPSVFPVTTVQLVNDQFTRSSTDLATYGWYVEPHLNFASRFFVAPGFRLDGNSSSGTHGGFSGGGLSGLSGLTGFPKANLSYLLVDRPTDPLWGVVSLFRTRLALGVAGTPAGPALKLRLFNVQGFAANDLSDAANELAYDFNGNLVTATTLSAIGNTVLQPERSGELEGGFETDLWGNRLEVTYTGHDKVRHNAIESVPIAQSVVGGGNYFVNIGEIRSTGTDVTVSAQVLENRAIGWNVGLTYSHSTERLVHLNAGQHTYEQGTGSGGFSRVVVGYPLWGMWAKSIDSYADINQDGVIERQEIRYGDSLVYLGQNTPKHTIAMHTDVSLFHGMLGVHASAAYQDGITQINQAAFSSGAIEQFGNAPGTTLAQQASIVAAGNGALVGLAQTVSELRFQTLSINYSVPKTVSRRLRIPLTQVALQGSNLGLHTNYRGIDPNVNAYSTSGSRGDQTADTGQLPLPRTWSLRFYLGN